MLIIPLLSGPAVAVDDATGGTPMARVIVVQADGAAICVWTETTGPTVTKSRSGMSARASRRTSP